jgi:2'-5' RNA ligase
VGQFAVLIVPPSSDVAGVEELRRRFDYLSDTVPAHVTLVFPFEHEPGEQDLLGHVRHATSGMQSFELELNNVTCSWDHYLFLLVGRGADEVRELHDRLYTGPLRTLLADRPFTPHLTIGRFSAAEECAAALRVVEPMEIRLRTIAEAVRIYDLAHSPYRVSAEVRLA